MESVLSSHLHMTHICESITGRKLEFMQECFGGIEVICKKHFERQRNVH